MRKIYLIFCLFVIGSSWGQKAKVYEYYVYLSDYRLAPQFEKNDSGEFSYTGKDKDLEELFKKYVIFEFSQAFPEFVNSEDILNVFLLKTSSENLIKDLMTNYSGLYKAYDDLTGKFVETLSYYPNDYGNTSPVANLGADGSKKDLDYIDAPRAWDITKGNGQIIVGISDTAIYATSPDFNGKTTFVSGYNGNYTGTSHGTDVAAIAAARGDNAHGTVGVCMDCSVLGAQIGFGSTSQLAFSNLYQLVNEGARIINMSWHNGTGYTHGEGYRQVEQDIINYLVNEYDAIFVAAAGNYPSYSTPQSYHSFNGSGVPETPFGVIYVYPASYDNVISVSNVNHKNPRTLPMTNSSPSYCCTSPWFPVHVDVEDAVGRSVNALDPMNPISVIRNGYYGGPTNPDGFTTNMTTNEKVDIMAPGYDIFQYSYFLNNGALYGTGTSYAAPQVSGTIGLMLSLNACLTSKEVEDVIQLTAKDLEAMALNQYFPGHIGAGGLNTGNAVDFVNEMNKVDGNAVIRNHIFNRFNFKLSKINNKLSLENVVFKESNNADFTAKNDILIVNSDFNPGTNSAVDLKLDKNIDVNCIVSARAKSNDHKSSVRKTVLSDSPVLYPNPNNGSFTIEIQNADSEKVSFEIFDSFGKPVFVGYTIENRIEINLTNLSSGLYLVKIHSAKYDETLKFIKK
jgi:hypothetical protein